MRKLYVLLTALLFGFGGFAQIAVTVTGNTNTTPALQASYASLTTALTALNNVTAMSGPVTLTCSAGSETAPSAAGFTLGSASLDAVLSATNTVTLTTTGGTVTLNAATGVATPSSAVPDGILKLVGADFVTINGLTFTDGNTANPASMEYGIGLFKLNAANGAQNNRIQNCTVNLPRVNNAAAATPMFDGSVGILVLNATPTAATTALTPSSSAGTNSNNKFYGNTINGGNTGIGLNGYVAPNGLPTPPLNDEGNDVGGAGDATATTGNTILNYGGASSATNSAAGIRANNQWGLNVSNNTVNNNNGSGANHPTTLRGIYAQAGAGANATISYNTVTVKGGGTTQTVFGIDNGIGSTASANTVSITKNTIQNCTYSSATTGDFIGIYSNATPATLNISDNQILNNSVGAAGATQACQFTGVFASSTPNNANMTNNTVSGNQLLSNAGDFFGLRGGGARVMSISGNNIFNNSLPNNAGTTACKLFGIYNASSPRDEIYSGNNVYNLSISGTSTGSHEVYGIYNPTSGTNGALVSGNNVNNLSFASSSAAGDAVVAGIRLSGDGVSIVSKNTVHSLTSTGTAPLVAGIFSETATGSTTTVQNNLVGNLTTPASTGHNLFGLYAGTGNATLNFYDNTVYLNATSTGSGFGSSAVFLSSTQPTVTLRNNLLVNLSTATGTGLTALLRRTATSLVAYGTASNNNLFYSGTPAANRLIYYDGTNADQTLAAFKTRVSPRESNSVTETVSSTAGSYFQSLTGPTTGSSAMFLHLVSGLQTLAESGAANISTVTDDYDSQTRAGNSGYLGTGSAPDIGADEFEGILKSSSCAPVSVPYTESFESIAVANTLPNCVLASPAPAAGGKTQTFVAAATGTSPALVARTGTRFVAVYYLPTGPGYYISAPLQLTGGVAYQASVYYQTDGVAWPSVGLKYGTSPSAAAMTNTIATITNAGATTYTQISGTFTPATSGVYYVSFFADNTGNASPNYIAFDDFSVTVAPACSAPTNLAVSSVGSNNAVLNWTAASPAPSAGYEIYYSTSPTPPTAGTTPGITAIAGTSQALNGLAASTTYYVWVRSNCGANGVTAWSAVPVSFTTLCTAVNLPYVESFDAVTPPGLPLCTSVLDANSDGSTWATASAPPIAGYSGNVLQYVANVFNAANDWFFTRGVNLTGGITYTLTFKFGNNSSTGFTERMKVFYGNNPAPAAMTTVLQDYANITGNVVNDATITFTPSTSGVYYLGFQAYSAANQNRLYLDDISLRLSGGCATPTNVTALTVTATGATIGWNESGSFVLEYGPSGFTPGTGATAGGGTIQTGSSPLQISGLASSTIYDVYVRQNCTSTGGGFSANSVKLSFTTLLANDEAVDAVSLTQTAYAALCSSVQFTTVGATPTSQTTACLAGSTDDDVWFRFTATNTKAILKVANYASASGTAGAFAYAIYTGTPGAFTEVECLATTLTAGSGEIALLNPLSVGQTYYLRVMTAGAAGRASFNLCVMTPDVSAVTTANACVSARAVTITAANGNSNLWVPIYTTDGKLVAEINGNGNTLGTVTTNIYRNTAGVRKDNSGKPYLDRNVEIRFSVQPLSAVGIRLYFTTTEFIALRSTLNSQVVNTGDLGVFRNNQVCSGVVAGAAFPLTTTVTPYENNLVAAINALAPGSFFIASNNFSALPANLLSFSGVRQGNANLLKWTVAQERDVQEYGIERSTDGRNFETVGTVQSAGNTSAQRSYAFTDNNPQGLRQYYRLRQVDVNGAEKLSGVILIQGSRPLALSIAGVYPNPVASQLNVLVDAPQKQTLTLVVMDAVGKTVRTQAVPVEVGSNNVRLSVDGLSQGSYLLKLRCSNGCESAVSKFIKQ